MLFLAVDSPTKNTVHNMLTTGVEKKATEVTQNLMAALDHVMLFTVYLTSGVMQTIARTMTHIESIVLYYLLMIFLFNHL